MQVASSGLRPCLRSSLPLSFRLLSTTSSKHRRSWKEQQSRRAYVEALRQELGIEKREDWKRVSCAELRRRGAYGLVNLFNGSSYRILADTHPELELQPFECAQKVPVKYWEEKENRRKFLDHVGRILGIEKMQEWREVSAKEVAKEGGSGLLRRYSCLLDVLQDTFDEVEWDTSYCRAARKKEEWGDREKRRRFMEKAGKELGVEKVQDWEKVKKKDLADVGGGGLLQVFRGSLSALLVDAFPEEKETIERLRKKPVGYWQEKKHRKEALLSFAKERGVTSAADWQKVTTREVTEHSRVLDYYGGSLLAALEDLLPSVSVTKQVAQGHWAERRNRRAFLEQVAEAHGVRQPSDWAKVRSKDVIDMGGSALIGRMGSVLAALRDAFPENREMWHEAICRPTASATHWKDPETVKKFLRHAGEVYQVEKPEDWARVSVEQLQEVGGGQLLKYTSLRQCLAMTYDNVDWEALMGPEGQPARKANQRLMALRLREICAAAQ